MSKLQCLCWMGSRAPGACSLYPNLHTNQTKNKRFRVSFQCSSQSFHGMANCFSFLVKSSSDKGENCTKNPPIDWQETVHIIPLSLKCQLFSLLFAPEVLWKLHRILGFSSSGRRASSHSLIHQVSALLQPSIFRFWFASHLLSLVFPFVYFGHCLTPTNNLSQEQIQCWN